MAGKTARNTQDQECLESPHVGRCCCCKDLWTFEDRWDSTEALPSGKMNELELEGPKSLFQCELDSVLHWLRSCSAADSCEACWHPDRGWTADWCSLRMGQTLAKSWMCCAGKATASSCWWDCRFYHARAVGEQNVVRSSLLRRIHCVLLWKKNKFVSKQFLIIFLEQIK